MRKYESVEAINSDIDIARREAISKLCSKYDIEDNDIVITVKQEAVHKLFKKQDAIVCAELSENAKKVLEEREFLEKKRLEEERERQRIIEQAKQEALAKAAFEERLCHIEPFKKMLLKIEKHAPLMLFTTFESIYLNFLRLSVGESPLNTIDQVCKDLELVWDEFAKIDINSEMKEDTVISIYERLASQYEEPEIFTYKNSAYGLAPDYQTWKDILIKQYDNRVNRYCQLIDGLVDEVENDDYLNSILKSCDAQMKFWKEQKVNDLYEKDRTEYNEIVYSLYFKDLYIIPMLLRDMYRAEAILEDEELTNIIVNSFINKSVDKASLYNVYEQYYSNAFDYILSASEFDSVCVLVILLTKIQENNEVMINTLELIGIDFQKLYQDIVENKVREQSVFHYLVVEMLEKGMLDCLMKNENHSVLFDWLLCLMICELVKENNIYELFPLVFEAVAASEREGKYFDKFILLHPEVNCSEKKARVEQIREKLDCATSGVDFEMVLADIFMQMGYKVDMTPTSGDQGADLVIEKDSRRGVIQAKFYASSVGNSAVQEVVASMKYYNAEKAMVITNSSFTNAAIRLAEANNVSLIDGNGLDAMINALL